MAVEVAAMVPVEVMPLLRSVAILGHLDINQQERAVLAEEIVVPGEEDVLDNLALEMVDVRVDLVDQ